VNALTARASTSQSQQLSSLQEDNRRLVSERTVLQTQVPKLRDDVDSRSRNTVILTGCQYRLHM
jgi:cell division protein FtsB